MKCISREQFEDILFNPDTNIIEKCSFKRSSVPGRKKAVIELISEGELVAVSEISPEGNYYYASED